MSLPIAWIEFDSGFNKDCINLTEDCRGFYSEGRGVSSTEQNSSGSVSPFDSPFDSPVVRLVFGIWSKYPQNALKILRRPIQTSVPLDFLERSLIRVCAKRHRARDKNASDAVRSGGFEKIEWEPTVLMDAEVSPVSSASVFPNAIRWADERQKLTQEQRNPGKAVVVLAAYTAATGEKTIRSFENKNRFFRHAHAEVALSVWHASQENLNKPTDPLTLDWVYVTLSPCKMCAAFLNALRVKRVYFRDQDPGPKAKLNSNDYGFELIQGCPIEF